MDRGKRRRRTWRGNFGIGRARRQISPRDKPYVSGFLGTLGPFRATDCSAPLDDSVALFDTPSDPMNDPRAASADETQIRQLIEQWADATRSGRQDEVLANHAPDVLIFDVMPPLQHEGAAAYRKSWEEWQPEDVGAGRFDLHNLQVTAGQDVGFAHALIHCGGTHPDGSTFEDWVRTTFCFCKMNGRWLVAHQHTSMPAGGSGEEK